MTVRRASKEERGMSDQSPPTRYVFTPEELQRFYAAKWKIQQCEICGVTSWAVDQENNLSRIATSGGIATASTTVTLHLRISCTSCGNTKFLLAATIRAWLDENP